MRLYLDEDIASALLVRLLRKAGHDVQTAQGAGLMGEWDPMQLLRAVEEGRALVTRNYCDFEDLHNLVIRSQGHHPRVLVTRNDNDPRKDMFPRDVVRAIRNLEAARIPTTDQYITLNQWQ